MRHEAGAALLNYSGGVGGVFDVRPAADLKKKKKREKLSIQRSTSVFF